MIYDGFDKTAVGRVKSKVEKDSEVINKVVEAIISPYCKDLDNYVTFIKDCLKDGEHPPTDSELEDFCLNLASYIYFAGGMCEQLGIKDDISRALYKETYNKARSSQNEGTVADKDSLAELYAQQEHLTNICYNRAFKTLKAKIENSQELLSSCKKVLTRRMQEYNLTNMEIK